MTFQLTYPFFCDIQHYIDFILGAIIFDLPHYYMLRKEYAILQKQIESLLVKRLIKELLSPCAVSTLLIIKKKINH